MFLKVFSQTFFWSFEITRYKRCWEPQTCLGAKVQILTLIVVSGTLFASQQRSPKTKLPVPITNKLRGKYLRPLLFSTTFKWKHFRVWFTYLSRLPMSLRLSHGPTNTTTSEKKENKSRHSFELCKKTEVGRNGEADAPLAGVWVLRSWIIDLKWRHGW